MKKDSNSFYQIEAQVKRRKLGVVVERKPQEVMAELVARLAEQLDVKIVPAVEGKKGDRDALRPNLDRLTVGVDLGDQWSNYCILGLGGETLAEGQFRTRKQETAEFFQGLATSRVVVEVGTHSAWVREIIACASPKLHPAEKLNKRLDILTVKSRLDRPTRASWKAMKTQADGILARHRCRKRRSRFRAVFRFICSN